MHDTRDKTQSQSYLAEHGEIVKQDKTAYLVMSTGHIIRRTDANEPPQYLRLRQIRRRSRSLRTAGTGLDDGSRASATGANLRTRQQAIQTQPVGLSRMERLVNPLIYRVCVSYRSLRAQARSTRSNRLLRRLLIGTICRLVGLALTNTAVARNPALVVPLYWLAARRHRFVVDDQGHGPSEKGLALVDRPATCAPVQRRAAAFQPVSGGEEYFHDRRFHPIATTSPSFCSVLITEHLRAADIVYDPFRRVIADVGKVRLGLRDDAGPHRAAPGLRPTSSF